MSLAAVSCGSALPRYDYSKEPDPRHREFIIGVGDVLAITVWRNPDLTTEAPVRPDGTITMPLLGDLRAAGKTPNALRGEITKSLATYITDVSAVVTVAITAVNSYRFAVSGEVVRPGLFTSPDYVTVAEAIAMAGGFTRFAKPSRIVIMRREKTDSVRRIPIDYEAIASGSRPEMNLVLLPGDDVHVP